MAFEQPNFDNHENAGIESFPLTKEYAQKTLEGMTGEKSDFAAAWEFVKQELEKVGAQKNAGIPVEEGLEEYLEEKEADFRGKVMESID